MLKFTHVKQQPKGQSEAEIAALMDKELIQRITEGRQTEDAIIQLHQRHWPWVIRRCRMRLGNSHDADDVAQDVFLRLMRSLNGYQGRGSFRAWLYRVVENECNDFAQKHSRMAQPEYAPMYVVEVSDFLNEDWMLMSKLESLPQLTRNVIYLRFFREYSLKAVGDTLGLGLSATKMRLYRGLRQMRLWCDQGDQDVRCT